MDGESGMAKYRLSLVHFTVLAGSQKGDKFRQNNEVPDAPLYFRALQSRLLIRKIWNFKLL